MARTVLKTKPPVVDRRPMRSVAKIIRTLSDLTPDSRNANKGTERGTALLEKSLQNYGAGRSVLVDKDGRIIAGNKTVEGAASIGLKKVAVVQTDGKTLVVVQRVDLDLGVDKAAKELAIADNRVAQAGLDWDVDVLRALQIDGVDLKSLWGSDKELARLLESVETASGETQSVDSNFLIVITCGTEQQQAELLERFSQEGLACKALVS